MTNRENSEKEIQQIKNKLKEYDKHIQSCLKKKELDLAEEIAQKIADLESELKTREVQNENLLKAENTLNEQRKKMRDQINERKSQIALFKAQFSMNEALRETAEAVGKDFSPELNDMAALAKRIEEKQQYELTQLKAAEKLHREDTGQDLDDKLIEAGIMNPNKPSVEEILNRYNQNT